MHIIESTLSRSTIDQSITTAVFDGHDPARWALPLLDEMQRRIGGWILVELDEAESGALWLPEHTGEPCRGDAMRLGGVAGGCTVRDAAAWVDAHRDAYAQSNRSCWSRITHATTAAASAIVASPFDVGDRVKPDAQPWVVVDGLHRAIGWWLSGRRTFRAIVPASTRPSDAVRDRA